MFNKYIERDRLSSTLQSKAEGETAWQELEAAALFLVSLSLSFAFDEVDEDFLGNLRSLEEFEWGKMGM